jgi:outer membrane protein OmpA-like peptidoglycan-associated protein
MNITPQYSQTPIPTVINPPTEHLRRENQNREIISQPAAASQSAAEKGLTKDKRQTSDQINQQYDFASLQKQAEREAQTINGDSQQSSEQQQQQTASQQPESKSKADKDDGQNDTPETTAATGSDTESSTVDPEQQQQIEQLASRDREVRAHEAAHAAVGGSATGAPTYSYELGPDGKRYVVDGEVSVDLSPVKGNPAATIAKMQTVHAAALAPAEPSVQDKQVAAQALRIIADAQAELLQIKQQDAAQSTGTAVKDTFKQQPNNTLASDEQVTPFDVGDTANQQQSLEASKAFDQLINATIKQQDSVVPSLSKEVKQRAQRIADFYQKITLANNPPKTHRFEISA